MYYVLKLYSLCSVQVALKLNIRQSFSVPVLMEESSKWDI
jgi:hypothetical protein